MASAGPAARADPPAPLGVVNLTASATREVTKDWLAITFSTTRDGPSAAAVQARLKEALDTALAEARRAARPGEVEVRTGGFSVAPRYIAMSIENRPPVSAVGGWRGSAELVVEGRDLPAIGALAGRITTLTIARVGYDLSRELKARFEGEVTAQAIAQFQQRAADCARQFGYASYAIREVTVNAVDASPFPAMPMLAMRSDKAAEEPLPVEPGKGTVTVNVSGSVQLSR